MSNYKYDDAPIRELQDNSVGKEVDEKIKNMTGFISTEDLDEWEFEEEIETFERIPRKNKRGSR